MSERVELRVELVDALHPGCEPLVVEGCVMGEGERGGTEVGEGKIKLVGELGLGVNGVCVGWGHLAVGGLAGGGLAAGVFEVASERVEVEDLDPWARKFARVAVELI
jgi:predicted methyltransferase